MTIAFLDLETTGLDRQFTEDHCPLIEIAIVLTDDNIVPFAQRDLLIDPRPDANGGRTDITFEELCEPEAFRMHQASGLLSAIDERQPGGVEMAEEALLDFLSHFDLDNGGPSTVPLAGFGVGRFDVPLLARWMPDLLERFHYRTIDVRTLTEVTRRWGDFGGAPTEFKAHRAMSDCHDAIQVLHWWRAKHMPDRSRPEPPAPHQTGVPAAQRLADSMAALRDSTPKMPPRTFSNGVPPQTLRNGESFEVGWTDSGVDRSGQTVYRGPVDLRVDGPADFPRVPWWTPPTSGGRWS